MNDNEEASVAAAAFTLRLVLRHPSAPLDIVGSALGLETRRSWNKGDPIKTPKGTVVGGRYLDSMWTHSPGERLRASINDEVRGLVGRLAEQQEFLADHVASGGSVLLTVDFLDVPVAAVLDADLLQAMGALGIKFGFEVFGR